MANTPDDVLDIGIDLDGCCYDFAGDLREWLVRSWGLERERLVEPTCWAFHTEEWGLSDQEFAEAYRSGVEAGALFCGGIEPGAASALDRLACAGHRLHVITARRAFGAGERVEELTRAWVRSWGLPVSSLTVTGSDKTAVASRLELDVAVDDSVANYEALEAAGVRTYLFDRAWNAEHPGRRVRGWAQFADTIAALAAA